LGGSHYHAIGNNPTCPNVKFIGTIPLFFYHLGLLGGWYDHESPTIRPLRQGDTSWIPRSLHCRLAYTPAAYISNSRHDFRRILRFIEQTSGFQKVSSPLLTTVLDGSNRLLRSGQPPRPFQRVSAAKDETYFLNDKTVPDGSGR